MEDIVDLLQIKIERAKEQLPEETQNAIASIDWKSTILEMRTKYGYSFEQLDSLELETELLLCGLLSSRDYGTELEKRMGISKVASNELVKEMNETVFSKIKEELIKNTERERIFKKSETNNNQVLNKAGINIIDSTPKSNLEKDSIVENREFLLQKIEKPTPSPIIGKVEITSENNLPVPEKLEITTSKKPEEVHPMLEAKFSTVVKNEIAKTEYSLNNISKTNSNVSYPKNADPYRLIPE